MGDGHDRVIICKKLDGFANFNAGVLGGSDALALPLHYDSISVVANNKKVIATLHKHDGGKLSMNVGKTYAGKAEVAGGIYAYWHTSIAPIMLHLKDADFEAGDIGDLLALRTTKIVNIKPKK